MTQTSREKEIVKSPHLIEYLFSFVHVFGDIWKNIHYSNNISENERWTKENTIL